MGTLGTRPHTLFSNICEILVSNLFYKFYQSVFVLSEIVRYHWVPLFSLTFISLQYVHIFAKKALNKFQFANVWWYSWGHNSEESHNLPGKNPHIEISISEDGFCRPLSGVHCSDVHRIRDIYYQDFPLFLSPPYLSCIHSFRNYIIQTQHEKYEAIKVDDTSLMLGLSV